MTLQVHKALPRDQRGTLAVDQYTMPANFRRKLKSLQHAPPICYSLPLDPQRRYDVSWTAVLFCMQQWSCFMLACSWLQHADLQCPKGS